MDGRTDGRTDRPTADIPSFGDTRTYLKRKERKKEKKKKRTEKRYLNCPESSIKFKEVEKGGRREKGRWEGGRSKLQTLV